MKQILAVAAAAAVALALAACSGGANTQSGASAGSDVASSTSSASATPAESAAKATAGLANPWSDAPSAAAAAEGAGVGVFQLPAEGTVLECGSVFFNGYRYMEGLAEADGDFGAAQFVMRKGLASVGQESGEGTSDVSGDYAGYAFAWEADIGGTRARCYGNEDGRAMKAIWASDGYCYSIMVRGQGDDVETFGLSADDIATLVGGIR